MKQSLRITPNLSPGPLAWMARNPVAANLMMVILLVGGFAMSGLLKKEVFPEVDLDLVSVSVSYPGASPEEVEEGILLAVEEEVRGVDGVKKVTASASEGVGVVSAELLLGADADRALADIKSSVDRITSFPEDAERPIISLVNNREQVLNLVIYGQLDRHELRDLSEQVRADLLEDTRITLVDTDGLPPPEISVEISQENLRRYGLTLQGVAAAISGASIDLPGGTLKTSSGEILLRTTERRNVGSEFDDIVLISAADGTRVLLSDVATVHDDFQDNDLSAQFNGLPAAVVKVFRVGKENPLDVAAAVHEYMEKTAADLPSGVGLAITNDTSILYEGRMSLLVDNGIIGGILVLIVLGIFLAPRLAFWVTMGLPISFMGAIFFLPALDVSINMISLFAFILTIGIVVDDAVVVGEAAFKYRREGLSPTDAAIAGVREVLLPINFAVLTTVVAFVPMLFVPGVMGKFFANIPLIVIPILFLSLFESMIILPAHLAHVPLEKDAHHWHVTNWFFKTQRSFSMRLESWIESRVGPMIERVINRRYLTLCASTALLLVSIGLVAGGRVPFSFFPDVEADNVTVTVELPFGTPAALSEATIHKIANAAWRIGADADGMNLSDAQSGTGTVRAVYAEVGRGAVGFDPGSGGPGSSGSGGHVSSLNIELAPAAERPIGGAEVVRKLRVFADTLPGIERAAFSNSATGGAGAAISVELTHQDTRTVESAAAELAEELTGYAGVTDINDGFEEGKTQLDFQLKGAARNVGLTERDLALQLRNAFFGAEAVRQQRGRDELRVYVRLPAEQRQSLYFVDNLIIRTPTGGEIPLAQVASVTRGAAFTEINRRDGRRILSVTADVDESIVTAQQVVTDLQKNVLPQLLASNPGLSYSLGGEQETQAESLGALVRGLALALVAMYALIAIAFRSYLQPLAVMLAIPFGFIGAVFGHLLMGFPISMISILGLIALAGVVVNGSLVLITAINGYRETGMDAVQAAVAGSTRRVRPVLLTSLTTFFGLAPMIFETDLQARFLVPMAVSLGFGVLLVTGIAVLLVPSAYLMIEDIHRLFHIPDADRKPTDVSPSQVL